MYEHVSDRLISFEHFVLRLLKQGLYVVGLMAVSVLVGALGFMLCEGLGIEDALLHSTHILSGFGLMEVPTTLAGRIFASLFGMYASLFFVAAFSMIFAPVVHRILHKLHLEKNDNTQR